jgi:hypothetical protein
MRAQRVQQIDVAPFRVARRLAELVPLREQAFDKALNAPVAIAAARRSFGSIAPVAAAAN